VNWIIEYIKKTIKIDNPIIVEIGACEGEDSLEFLRLFGNKTQAHCFEADPRNIKKFEKKVNHPRCHLYPLAISHIDGKTTFYQSFGKRPGSPDQVDRCSSGSINKPQGHLKAQKWCSFNDGIEVPSITLDTWCKQNNIDSIDLIWADVNGGEASMIEGAYEAFKFTKYIYTEFGPSPLEAKQWFNLDVENNFKLFENGINRETILDLLPDFEQIRVINNNVFMRNRNLT
jgi:FkbM family methyltransferase